MVFWYIHDNTHAQTNIKKFFGINFLNKLSDFLKTCFRHFPPKNEAETIKMQNTGEKQQFTWTNKLMDGFISNPQNFKALRSFKASISK